MRNLSHEEFSIDYLLFNTRTLYQVISAKTIVEAKEETIKWHRDPRSGPVVIWKGGAIRKETAIKERKGTIWVRRRRLLNTELKTQIPEVEGNVFGALR